MKKWATITAIGALALGLTGCGNMTKQDMGTLTGGAIGGLVGSQFGGGSGQVVGIIGGTLLGAFIGNQIGHSMDQTDQLMMQRSMSSGAPTSWTNERTGDQYRVVPGAQEGRCRNYTMYATVEGKRRPIHGTACKENGKWVAQN